MKIIPLGAGQDVGRSCLIVYIQDKTIMLDCGMHMGYHDLRKFPDFSFLAKYGSLDKILDCVIISHFHLDHSGALAYFTEKCGYNGPVFMTPPTKAVVPLLLEDYRKIIETELFNYNDIVKSMGKVRTIEFGETVVFEGITIRPYYAGHVLGAAMFYISVNGESLVYTGDFNTTADKHLGPARIDCVKPDVLISEATYGSIVRECRKLKEMEFLNSIHECVERGGKVLIPTFALGRAQELSSMVDAYWDMMKIKVPIYSSAGLTEQATKIYKTFKNYTSEFSGNKELEEDIFEYKDIKVLKGQFIDPEGPVVLFSSPGVLNSGMTLSIFKKWCNNPKNMVIIPGYCVKGTLGEKILNGLKRIKVGNEVLDIQLEIKNLAFSAHADSTGIYQIINQCQPDNLVLVHGEKSRMSIFRDKLKKVSDITVYLPANGEVLNITPEKKIKLKIPVEFEDDFKVTGKKIGKIVEIDEKEFIVKNVRDFISDKKTN